MPTKPLGLIKFLIRRLLGRGRAAAIMSQKGKTGQDIFAKTMTGPRELVAVMAARVLLGFMEWTESRCPDWRGTSKGTIAYSVEEG
jgi:hypothetical protein